MSSKNTGVTGLAGRYATALYDLADEGKALDMVAGDLARLAEMIDGIEDLERLIRSPVISHRDQGRAMAAVLEKVGICDLVRSFVGTVAHNRRLFALRAMISAYLELLAARRGETTAEVTSARELSGSQLKAVAASLKKAVGTKVTVDARVDPRLLGGLVVRVGSRMVDSSLSTKLRRLGLVMKGIG